MASLTGLGCSSNPSLMGNGFTNNIHHKNNINNNYHHHHQRKPSYSCIESFLMSFKNQLLRDIIQPYIKRDWRLVRDNLLSFASVRERLEEWIRQRGDDNDDDNYDPMFEDLIWYRDLFFSFDYAVHQDQECEMLNVQLFGNEGGVSSSVVRLPLIRLKPEYEIYHRFRGQPGLGASYDATILQNIRRVLSHPRFLGGTSSAKRLRDLSYLFHHK